MSADKNLDHTGITEDIFNRMYRDLRSWNRDVPDSPERADPVLRILLQLFAFQLGQLDQRISATWEKATESLVRTVAPEIRRWPVPAYTVMQCEPADPVVEIDPTTRFYFRERREGATTLFFAPHRKEKLLNAKRKHCYAFDGNRLSDLSAGPKAGQGEPSGECTYYVGLEYDGVPSDFTHAAIYVKAEENLAGQIQWAEWTPAGEDGAFLKRAAFCPGAAQSLEDMFSDDKGPAEWGGFRASEDLFYKMQNNWVILTPAFATSWSKSPVPGELAGLMERNSLSLPPDDEQLFWVRLTLPDGGDKSLILGEFQLLFNCVVATNKEEQSVFKHVGGNPLVEVELTAPLDSVLGVTSVEDSAHNVYLPRHELAGKKSHHTYSLEERDDNLVLWFDFSSSIEPPPDSLIIKYNVTAGTEANGIAEGQITDLYERHPGINEAINLIPVSGAVPARTKEQLMTEVSTRLRSRDRALNFSDISDWARTFDPRIKDVTCSNGVERATRGIRRCIVVSLTVDREAFYSRTEADLMGGRLQRFLKSRAPVNTHFRVEIVQS